MTGHQKKNTDILDLQSALADEFGMHVKNLARIDEKDLGDRSEAFVADLDGQKIIIKTIPDDEGIYPIEAASLELLASHGIPVAKFLGFAPQAKHINKPILIQTAVAGIPMSSLPADQRTPEMYQAAGRILKSINQIKVAGFGKLKLVNGSLIGESHTWKEGWMTHRPDGAGYADTKYLMDHGFINADQAKRVENTFDEVAEIDLSEASFLHNDCGEHHIFTDGKRITGLIDMGGVSSGDPRMDIAKSHYFLSKQTWVDFDSGYGAGSLDSMINKYFLLVAARKLVYRHSNNYTNRIPDAVKKLQQALTETE